MPSKKPDSLKPDPMLTRALGELDAQATVQVERLKTALGKRARARAAGIPVERFSELPPELRAKFETLAGPTLGEVESVMRTYDKDDPLYGGTKAGFIDVAERDLAIATVSREIAARRDADEIVRQLTDGQEDAYVTLLDPPVRGVHRGRSSIHWTQVQQALKQGFSATPVARVLGPPTVRCRYEDEQGDACPMTLYTTADREAHERAKHRLWFALRDAARREEREELSLEMLKVIAGRTQPAQAIGVPSGDISQKGRNGADTTDVAKGGEDEREPEHGRNGRDGGDGGGPGAGDG
jgi:hypothetical protein